MGLLDGVKRNVLILGIVSFLTDVSSEMVFPLLPLFITSVLGAGKEIVGLMEGVADSIAGLTDIVFGYWSDRRGKRKEFVIAGYGLSTLLKAGLVFATSWPVVFFIRVTERLGKSIRTSPRDAIIAASSEEKDRGKVFGLHRTMDTVGAIAGPAIAYLILASLGNGEGAYRTVFAIALIPAILAVTAIIILVREPKTELKTDEKNGKTAERPKFWEMFRKPNETYNRYLLVSCIFSLAYFSFALLIVRASDLGLTPQNVLLVYLLYNITYALAAIPAGTISDRIGRKPMIAGAFLLYGLICLGFIFATGEWQVAALFAVYGVFVATDETVNKAYISDITDEKTRGMALGAYNSAVGAVYLPASAIFGILWVAMGTTAAFGVAAAIAVVAAASMALYTK